MRMDGKDAKHEHWSKRGLAPFPNKLVVLEGGNIVEYQGLFQNLMPISVRKDLNTSVVKKPTEVLVESILAMFFILDSFRFLLFLHWHDEFLHMLLMNVVPIRLLAPPPVKAANGETHVNDANGKYINLQRATKEVSPVKYYTRVLPFRRARLK
jgi:hypothetical protein